MTQQPPASPQAPSPKPEAGLCATCRHSHVITSARGSKFYLCRRAELDPSFKRYPPLPVRQCSGFEEDGRQATTRTRE